LRLGGILRDRMFHNLFPAVINMHSTGYFNINRY